MDLRNIYKQSQNHFLFSSRIVNYAIPNRHTDDQGKPTNETLKQNIAKIEPGYPLCSWDIGSIQKTYNHYTNNEKLYRILGGKRSKSITGSCDN